MTWAEAADLLEAFLEDAGRIIDGDLPEGDGTDALGSDALGAGPLDFPFEFTDEPDEATVIRLLGLIDDSNEALAMMSLRRAEIQQELGHNERLRAAGSGYLRYQ